MRYVPISKACTTRKGAISQGTMPGARTPGKFTRSNARDAPGKMTSKKVGHYYYYYYFFTLNSL